MSVRLVTNKYGECDKKCIVKLDIITIDENRLSWDVIFTKEKREKYSQNNEYIQALVNNHCLPVFAAPNNEP